MCNPDPQLDPEYERWLDTLADETDRCAYAAGQRREWEETNDHLDRMGAAELEAWERAVEEDAVIPATLTDPAEIPF